MMIKNWSSVYSVITSKKLTLTIIIRLNIFMTERKHLSEQEVHSLISSLPDSINHIRNQCLIAVCFSHGLRASELTGLMLSDINMDEKTIHIARLKNGLSTNQPLQSLEYELLTPWLEQRNTSVHYAEPWLFLSRKGGRLSRQQIFRIIRDSGLSAHLNIAAHPHMLRHACGYALADRGTDTRLIQDYLGHRNIQHTVLYTASNVARFRSIKL